MPSTTASESSLASQARRLVSRACVGALATHSARMPGFPFASATPYAADRFGRPIFLFSTLAMHTQNLQADWRASLLVTAPGSDAAPLSGERVTLIGSLEQVAAEEVRNVYLNRHPDAAQWANFGDFAFYRLSPRAVYFVGGFGVMGWLTAQEYEVAAGI